ncbi:MAG: hypothetical protein M3004_02370, partial [Bacteroidota bacterium]|nr:hypothetical protein [Bacteroidota bacterium]
MRKIIIVVIILLVLSLGGYLYIRFHVLKTNDFKPDETKEKNIVDLRPSIIAKLQQLVKEGSNGLYILSIDKIEPDVLGSKVSVANASIHIDTAAMHLLDRLKKLPDDIFTIRFKSLHIDGIGINDLLNKNNIDIKGINISDPVIELFHKKRTYNEKERERNDTLSLYYRLKGQMKKIAIGSIRINQGTLFSHDLKKNATTKYNDVSILINDLLIDSSTQNDTRRFLFAKHATFTTKNYSLPTSDSLYFFKAGNISISGEQ